jgi:hypothetical protein
VLELVDSHGLGPWAPFGACGFESHPQHISDVGWAMNPRQTNSRVSTEFERKQKNIRLNTEFRVYRFRVPPPARPCSSIWKSVWLRTTRLEVQILPGADKKSKVKRQKSKVKASLKIENCKL